MSGLPMDMQVAWRKEVKTQLEEFEGNVKAHCCNPVDYYNFENNKHDNEREIMEFDLNKVRNSDLLIVNFNNPKSMGTMAELAIAYDRQIPIIGLYDGKLPELRSNGALFYRSSSIELHPWQDIMCYRIFKNIEDLTTYVKEFYLT